MTPSRSELMDIVISALWSVKGECTEHTSRRITKANCEVCTAKFVVDALEKRGIDAV